MTWAVSVATSTSNWRCALYMYMLKMYTAVIYFDQLITFWSLANFNTICKEKHWEYENYITSVWPDWEKKEKRTHQSPLQRVQVSSHLSQQEMQFVADDVDLLLGLHAVFSSGLQEELRGDLLQRGDLPLAAAELLLQSLQQGATESTAVRSQLRLNRQLNILEFCVW